MGYVGWVNRARAVGRSHPVSLALLIAANVVPIVGVVFLGWDVATILILYWLENGIVGLLNVPKIVLATRFTNGRRSRSEDYDLATTFLVHYGFFWLVHGVFVFVLTAFADEQAPNPQAAATRIVAVASGAVLLLVSHGANFYLNFVRQREYERISPAAQQVQPYARMFVLHFTILLGGLAIIALGQPVGLVALLVAFKTIVDVLFYVRQHSAQNGAEGKRDDDGRIEPGEPAVVDLDT